MSKIKQDKIYLTQDESGNLHMTEEIANMLQGNPNANANYRLVRERDGLTKHGQKLGWIEWADGKFYKLHDEPAVGLSCILDPHRMSFTWCTTAVTEILEEREDYIKFNTQNSAYELFKNIKSDGK
jgi:hypothetical protein